MQFFVALLLTTLFAVERAAARTDYTAWQEITVLTVSKLENAAASCGYMVNGKQLKILLDSADLDLDEVHSRPRSTSLQKQIDANTASFRLNREAACADAWNTFGADGQARDFLTQ